MITFKAIIVPGNKRQDGVYPVKIRVTFKGKSRRLPTTLVCYPEDLTRSNKIKNKTLLLKADNLIGPMREAVSDISPFDLDARDVDWVVDYIRAKLAPARFRLDFFEFADEFLDACGGWKRENYLVGVNLFRQFIGGPLDINDITTRLLTDFVRWSEAQPKMVRGRDGVRRPTEIRKVKGGSYRELSKLSTIFNEAKRRYNDEDRGLILIPRSPFANVVKEAAISQGQKNLGMELMQRIISDNTQRKSVRFALDMFVTSFALMGANVADMCNHPKVVDGVWRYERVKTRGRRQDKAEMRVVIPEVAQPFIERLKGPHGEFLGALRGHKKEYVTKCVNYGLTIWCEANGVERFTMYAARHSFASIARKIGVEKATVDECLAHVGEFRMADIYADRDWDAINAANAKVIAQFVWPDA